MTITSKLPDVGTSIFAVMSALAAQHGAVILSQGFPEFDSYVPAIRLNGGKPVAVPMTFPDYRIEWNAVEEAEERLCRI